ncbi:MAG: hypothetical protein ABS84_00985 [Rubrivivax sp. SCN 71-131]|nr:MAG: hypothetical protein ABS84_00985 [Rubrivivax sp. SCN 71-131]
MPPGDQNRRPSSKRGSACASRQRAQEGARPGGILELLQIEPRLGQHGAVLGHRLLEQLAQSRGGRPQLRMQTVVQAHAHALPLDLGLELRELLGQQPVVLLRARGGGAREVGGVDLLDLELQCKEREQVSACSASSASLSISAAAKSHKSSCRQRRSALLQRAARSA